MKAKVIKKGVPVLVNLGGDIQGSIVKSKVFIYRKQMCVKLVGFGNWPCFINRLEVI